jgi:hypothetical protein
MRSFIICIVHDIRVIRSRIVRWAGHVERMVAITTRIQDSVGKAEGNSPLGRRRNRRDNNIQIGFQEREMRHRPDLSGAGYGHVEGSCECGSGL